MAREDLGHESSPEVGTNMFWSGLHAIGDLVGSLRRKLFSRVTPHVEVEPHNLPVDLQRLIERMMCHYPAWKVDDLGCFTFKKCTENIQNPNKRSGDREFIITGNIRKRTGNGHESDPVEITVATTQEGQILSTQDKHATTTYNRIPANADLLITLVKELQKKDWENNPAFDACSLTIKQPTLMRETRKDGTQKEWVEGFVAFDPPLSLKGLSGTTIVDGAYFTKNKFEFIEIEIDYRSEGTTMNIPGDRGSTAIKLDLPRVRGISTDIRRWEE